MIMANETYNFLFVINSNHSSIYRSISIYTKRTVFDSGHGTDKRTNRQTIGSQVCLLLPSVLWRRIITSWYSITAERELLLVTLNLLFA